MTRAMLSVHQSLIAPDPFSSSSLATPSIGPCPSRLAAKLHVSVPPATAEPGHLAPSLAADPMPSRCAVKGCVFPVSSDAKRRCRYHELFASEAHLFQSHQPSHLLAIQALPDILEIEVDDSRQKDRARQAAEREAFLLEEPA
jgi:hypothetical protein